MRRRIIERQPDIDLRLVDSGRFSIFCSFFFAIVQGQGTIAQLFAEVDSIFFGTSFWNGHKAQKRSTNPALFKKEKEEPKATDILGGSCGVATSTSLMVAATAAAADGELLLFLSRLAPIEEVADVVVDAADRRPYL